MSSAGFRLAQTAGRSACPKIRQRLSSSNCTQRTPAGFPIGMPGIADEIDGAVQQAPQPLRHDSWDILFLRDRRSLHALGRMIPQEAGR